MIAVITGDLVHSGKMTDIQLTQAQQIIEQQLASARQQGGAGALYRGDAFQLALPQPAAGLRAALLIVTALRSEDYRVTLSLGVGAGPVSKQPRTAQSPAYVVSGRGLEQTARGDLSVHSESTKANEMLALTTAFLSFLLQNLTRKQAQVLYAWVEASFCEHHLVATKLATSRQNVSLHLQKLGGHLIEAYSHHFHQWLNTLVGSLPSSEES